MFVHLSTPIEEMDDTQSLAPRTISSDLVRYLSRYEVSETSDD